MQYIIPTIFTATDKFSRPVMRMEAALTSFTTIGGAAGARLTRSLSRTSAAAMEVATSAAMIGAAVLIPLGIATKSAIDFEKQMGNVATLVDTAKESMTAMGDAVMDVASRVPVKVADLTESLYQIRSAGVEAGQAMHVLEISAKLSVAGLSSATDATKAVTSAMVSFRSQGLTSDAIANSFFLTVKEGKTKMDGLNASFGENAPLVASAGVKLQEFNAATAAMTNAGMTASEAQNGIRMSVLGLIKPTSEMTEVFNRLGVASGEQLLQKMNGLGGALDAVSEASKQMNIEAPKLFNRTALTSYTLLVGNLRDAFKANTKEQMTGANAVNDAYYKQLGTTASQAQLAKNNLEILSITVGTLLLPVFNAMLKIFTPIINKLTSFAHNHKRLSSIVLGSISVFGVFAATVAILSFTIGTVTKAVWLWSVAVKAIGFVQGLLAVATGALNGELLLLPGAAKGASVALGMMNLSATALLGTLGKTAGVLIGIYAAYKGITELMDLKAKNDAANPLGLNFNGDAADNQSALTKNNLSDSQYQILQKQYQNDRLKNTQSGFYGGIASDMLHDIFGLSKVSQDDDSNDNSQQAKAIYSSIDGDKPVMNQTITVNVDKDGQATVTSTGEGFNMPGIPQTHKQ